MLVYTATKEEFREDVRLNRIEERVLARFVERLGQSTSQSEVDSWRNSLIYMDNVIDVAAIPDDVGVAIEYRIPQTGKRIDFILSGFDANDASNVIITELKQWQEIGVTEKDAIVETRLGGDWRETTHPSYQAWSYAQLLRDFNAAVELNRITLFPCVYLHNCSDGSAIRSDRYTAHLNNAPVFLRNEVKAFAAFLNPLLRIGDEGRILRDVENGVVRPSKDLASHLSSLLNGNAEFTMIDDQKVVYETVLNLASRAGLDRKFVVIVNGGPGTGKSVVAINLLVELLNRGLTASYVTSNSAPRNVYESKLTGAMRKGRISSLFRGSGTFFETEHGSTDVLVVDEAHRLKEKSGMFDNLGEHQIKEIISAAHLSVFFLDENQRVTLRDIGSREEIIKHARLQNAELLESELTSQFRCNGSDGYLAWVDHTLQIRSTSNETLDGIDYDFRVCSHPNELRELVAEKNVPRNKSRLVAGYCWPWASKKDKAKMDICFPEHAFAMQWNLADDGMLWLIRPDSIDQIGCIHTCQGLELDYVGVIIGPDLVVRKGTVVTDALQRARHDKSIKGYKGWLKQDPTSARREADLIIKNTYRVLMTRGLKGCFVWAVDDETNEWLRCCSRL